jgi:hypothetical protein
MQHDKILPRIQGGSPAKSAAFTFFLLADGRQAANMAAITVAWPDPHRGI